MVTCGCGKSGSAGSGEIKDWKSIVKDTIELLNKNKILEIEQRYFGIGKLYFERALDNSGRTVLLYSVMNGNTEFVKMLLRTAQHKALLLSQKDKFGNTALHLAVLIENVELARQLLENGANKTIVNSTGETPVSIAEKSNTKEICELFFPSELSLKDKPIERAQETPNKFNPSLVPSKSDSGRLHEEEKQTNIVISKYEINETPRAVEYSDEDIAEENDAVSERHDVRKSMVSSNSKLMKRKGITYVQKIFFSYL